MMDLLLIENEILWLQSIGCVIQGAAPDVTVLNLHNSSTDFNFSTSITQYCEPKYACYRLSGNSSELTKLEQLLYRYNYQPESTFDINLVSRIQDSDFKYHKSTNLYEITEIHISEWCAKFNENRLDCPYIRYFLVLCNGKNIGKISIVSKSDVFWGLYDFEIFDEYRSKGHGSKFLQWLVSSKSINIEYFIQTWSTNLDAIKCYISAGFNIYDNLFRFIRKQ